MNTFKNSVTLVLMCMYAFISAQNADEVKKRGPADDYARSSISYLLLDFENEPYAAYLSKGINSTTVPSKFDNNNLSKKYIKAPYYHMPNKNQTSTNTKKIVQALIAENYPVDVVKYWWQIKEDGTYSTELIQKRGYYNATDEDVSKVDATKVGRAKLGDAGLKLISNSYVMVLDFQDIKTMEDIYDAQDEAAREKAKKDKTEFVPVKRVKNGFTGKVTSYLFKINYSDTVQGYFDQAFIDEEKIDVQKLNEIFNHVYSPVKLITTETQNVDGTQPNPGEFLAPTVQKSKEQLAVVLVNNGITKSLDRIETRIEAFRVKTAVSNVNPIRAKIGKKESLTYERRYFVWQYAQGSNEKVVAKRKGVIRAKKVIDNRNDELGNTRESAFYQIGGGKITEGMTLQERKDLGIGIGGGYGSAGGIIRADINMGQWANAPVKQLKLYGELIFGSKKYTDIVPILGSTMADGDFSEFKFSVGILKEYPIGRGNSVLGWAIGYTGQSITIPKVETNPNYDADRGTEQLSMGGFNWSARFGINLLSPSFQLIGQINGHHYGNPTYKSGIEGDEDLSLEEGLTDIFPDYSSISFDLSLRINF